MRTINKYQNEHEEFLHPLWLGILILFTVLIIVGLSCCLRKQYGSQLRHFFNRLCCRNMIKKEHLPNINKHLLIPNPYNWAPAYVPAQSVSPRLYKLVRNIQKNSVETASVSEHTNSNEDDLFSIDESDQVKTTLSKPKLAQVPNKNRTSEAARRLYASMRHTSAGQASSSVESTSNEPGLLRMNRLDKSNRDAKLKFVHTPRFFQSITNKR